MMRETIGLQFSYTKEEYMAATRLYLRRSTDFKIRIAVCVLYAAVCIFMVWLLGLEFDSQVLILAAFVAFLPFFIAFMQFVVLPQQRFRGDPAFREQYLLQFSDDGVQFRTAQVDALLRWSLFNKVLEDERFYLLVYGKNMISVIPKRAFAGPAQEAAFRQLLARHLSSYFGAQQLVADAYVPPAEPPDWR